MLSREQLERAAAASGFQIESYEKVYVLVRLLDALRMHPFLGPRMALKGGTALNLFVLGLPRLSVDLDLNYVGAADRELVPMLRLDVRPAKIEIATWTETLVRETRDLMAAVLPLATHEREFLERLNGAGTIAPELLTDDAAMRAIIQDHPGLKWKALNVKRRLGGAVVDDREPPA